MSNKGLTYNEGNEHALTHGHERAVKALSSGDSLVGVAHQLELQADAEIASDGLVAVMHREAVRYLAVARIFHGLILGCEDVAQMDKLVKRYGWLASKAWRMLQELHEMQGDTDAIDYQDLIREQQR